MSQNPKTPSVITQQPQIYPQGGVHNFPSQFIPQQMPMNQDAQQLMYGQPYGPHQVRQPGTAPMAGTPIQQQNAVGGMMSPVVGGLNGVANPNPTIVINSSGGLISSPVALPLMPMAPVEGCPNGLEFLIGTEHLLVKQQVEKMGVLLGQLGASFESPNRYDILNTAGQRIYFAAEVGEVLLMQCSPTGRTRPFRISIIDFSGRQILTLERPYSCEFCFLSCFNFCGTSGTQVTVSLGDGSFLGVVKQKSNGWQPMFQVIDNAGNIIATIQGESCGDCCCSCSGACCGDIKFTVFATDGTSIGLITKKWSGFLQETFTDADTFGVSFLMNMDVRTKALLLGAVFLIDFMFFEENPNVRRNNRSNWSGLNNRSSFGNRNSFGSHFGHGSSWGHGSHFGHRSLFDHGSSFGHRNHFGHGSIFDHGSSFGHRSLFDHGSSFGHRSLFDHGSSFGHRNSWGYGNHVGD